jgi:hypothetical protein
MVKKRIGEILLEKRVITPKQLEAALAHHRRTGNRVGTSLVATGAISEATLCHALSEALRIPEIDLRKVAPEWAALRAVTLRFCETHDVLPISLDETRSRKVLQVAMADPLNLPVAEELGFTTGFKVIANIATLSGIRTAIDYYYRKKSREPQLSEEEEASGVMTLVRPGGGEVRVTTSTEMPAVRGALTDETPVVTGRIIESETRKQEVTSRSALADLIQQRAEQRKRRRKGITSSVTDDLSYLTGTEVPNELDETEELERRFWALLRLLAKKGLISKEEFLSELDEE